MRLVDFYLNNLHIYSSGVNGCNNYGVYHYIIVTVHSRRWNVYYLFNNLSMLLLQCIQWCAIIVENHFVQIQICYMSYESWIPPFATNGRSKTMDEHNREKWKPTIDME